MMNFLYLETGGKFENVLSLNYWRFKSIVYTLNKRNTIKSGKPWIERGIPQSSKDMIAKRKEQR